MKENPVVAVVMGSPSDLEIMKDCLETLQQFEIPHEVRILSAHRTPEKTAEFAKSAMERGLRVIIAAAGKAAHLAGVIASLTPLPVIGVPIPTSDLGGLDSLLSMVQMPAGIPVATVAIGKAGAKNAALLAMAILSLGDLSLRKKIESYRQTMQKEIEAKDQEISQNLTRVENER